MLDNDEYKKDVSIEYYIAFNMALGVNTVMKHRVMNYYKGDLEYIFHKASFKELRPLFSKESTAKKFYDARADSLKKSERELKVVNVKGIDLVPICSDNYPYMLRRIYDPPILLYLKGNLVGESHLSYISIVGSRKASGAGISNAYKVAKGIASLGIVVVSGLALGIDSASHKGSIDGGGKTIGVLACGVDVVYPRTNNELFDRVVDNGCILSEFSLGTAPAGYHFPIRNRIIAGLSIAVVVVEAGEKSGALHTTRHALDWGRDVYAFPGPAGSPYYSGSHSLIKEGARLIENENDLLEDLKLVLDFDDSVGVSKKSQPIKAMATDMYSRQEDFLKEKVKKSGILKGDKVNKSEKEEPKEEDLLLNDNGVDKKNVSVETAIAIEGKDFDEDTKIIYACLDYKNKKTFDEIVEETGLSVPKVISILNFLYLTKSCSKEDEFYYRNSNV